MNWIIKLNNLSNWQACELPNAEILEGRFTRLELLNITKHGANLFAASNQEDAGTRFKWLPSEAPKNMSEFENWLEKTVSDEGSICYVVIDKRTGKICGRQMFLRLDPANGSIEIGNIYWNKDISRTPVTTEALYLFATYIFDDLGYRRFEWKCNNENEPSKNAAVRFGFQYEGLFRQNSIVKGKNRDTAWYSIIDGEWAKLKQAFVKWMEPENFDAQGRQKTKLSAFIKN